MSFLVCPYSFLWIFHLCVPLRFSLDCPSLCAPTVFPGLSTFVCPYGFLWTFRTRVDNPEKNVRVHKKGQPRENRKGSQGWTIQGKPKGSTRVDNPEKTGFFLGCPFLCAPTVFSGLSTLVCPYCFIWFFHLCVPLRFSLDCPPLCAPTRKENPVNAPEKTVGKHEGGQSKENRRATQERTIQRKPLGHTKVENPEKTVGAHKKGQSRENCRGTQGMKIQRTPSCVPTVFSGVSTFVCPYGFLWIVHPCVPLQFSLDFRPCVPLQFPLD
jgi:hypothetical protein